MTPLSMKDQETSHLLYFANHAFHQLESLREEAVEELKKRKIPNLDKINHVCMCKSCVAKRK